MGWRESREYRSEGIWNNLIVTFADEHYSKRKVDTLGSSLEQATPVEP